MIHSITKPIIDNVQLYCNWLVYIIKNKNGAKHYGSWKKTTKGKEVELPWIPFLAIDWLEKYYAKNKKALVFEYGSGLSTLYHAKYAKQVVSVEHNRDWYTKMKRRLDKIKNVKYYFIPTEISENDSYKSTDKDYAGHSFKKYVTSINRDDKKYDLIIVDGRARNACITEAVKHLKKGGFLMLDNSERSEYEQGKKLLKQFKSTKYYGPGPINDYFWENTIYKKI